MKNVYILRHCHTNKATDGSSEADAARMPDDKGVVQIETLRRWLFENNVVFQAGFHSSLKRTAVTLEGLTVGSEKFPVKELRGLTHIDKPYTELMNSAFDKAKVWTIKNIYQTATAEEKLAMYRFGRDAWNELEKELSDIPDGSNIIVVSHAVFIQLLTLVATPKLHDYLMTVDVGECQGFQLGYDDGEIVSFETIK